MSEEPIISVIVPVYNTENYLRDCLASIQRQTLSAFEVLIINDKTPDNSMAIAREFSIKDSRFRIINHKVNKGPGGARNTGIDNAKGLYIYFLDSDDIIPIDALELLWETSKYGILDMVIGNMAWYQNNCLTPVKYIDSRLRSWTTSTKENMRKLPDSDFSAGSIVNRLFNRELLIQKKIDFPEDLYFEDMVFSVKVWFFSESIYPLLNTTYFRIKRQDPLNLSITQTYNRKTYVDRDKIANLIYEFCSVNRGSEMLGVTTLTRLFSTSKQLLNSAPDDIKHDILFSWFPKHLLRINRLINALQKKM